MCEIKVGRGLPDDFSLLNAAIADAELAILGSNSGFTLGNADNEAAVHRIVDQLLRNADGPIRQQVIPIKVLGPHRAARGEMAARVRVALRQATRVTIIPCDGWGAPGWFRLEGWNMDIVSEDYRAKYNGEQLYTITLNVDAWAKAEERYTAAASNALPAVEVWSSAADDDTGWVASNGTLDPGSGTSYVGVESDGSSITRDTLRYAGLAWDPSIDGGYSLVAVEAKVNPDPDAGEVGNVESGGIFPAVYVQGQLSDSSWVDAAISMVSRVDLGSGWYRETLLLGFGLPAMEGIGVVATGGDPDDQDLKIRKIELLATNTFASGAAVMYLNIPGSEPTDVDLEVTQAQPGVLVYTGPVFADFPDYSPLNAGGVANEMPEGVYHLVIDRGGGTATKLDWQVTMDGDVYRSGTTTLADLPYDSTGFICLCTNLYLPPAVTDSTYTGEIVVTVSGADGTLTNQKTLLLWMEDVLTGKAADYTMTGVPTVGGTPSLRINARTPERPVPSYTIGGIQNDADIRAAGDHFIEPGLQRVLVAWSGSAAPEDADFTAGLYPAFHTDVPPSIRWFAT